MNPFKYFTKDWQTKKVKEVCEKRGVDTFNLLRMVKWANMFEKFIFATLKFFALMWIFTKYYKSAGFEKVIITLLVIIMVIMISSDRDKLINM